MKYISIKICLVIVALFGGVAAASDLPDCPKNVWHNCFGTGNQPNGDKYVGEYKDGNWNGQGTYTFGPESKMAGDKYVGGFKDGKVIGQGTLTFGPESKWAGDKYVGGFKDGNYNGQGIYTFADGQVDEGTYKDNNLNGQATVTYADGTVKEGIWKDNEFQYAKASTKPVPVVKTPAQDDQTISASSGSGFAVSSDGYVITLLQGLKTPVFTVVNTSNGRA